MSEGKDFNVHFQKGEKILLQTKAIEDKKLRLLNMGVMIIFGIAGIILLIIAFHYLIHTPPAELFDSLEELLSYKIIGFLKFLFLSLVCFTIMIVILSVLKYNAKTTFYITSDTILRVTDTHISFVKPKFYKISFSNISHLIVWDWGIEIIPKKSNREVYYKGDETHFFHKMWGLKAIIIRLNGYKGKKILTKAVEILTKEVPLRQHPNMDFLYITS